MSTENAVAALLREAEHAHGEYEVATLGGVRDEAWPVWYATYLLDHGLGDVLPGLGAAGEETLAARLSSLAAAYDQDRPDTPWPEFYAARLASEW